MSKLRVATKCRCDDKCKCSHNYSVLDKSPEKKFKDSNPWPLRYCYNALPTELSKAHESAHVWVIHGVECGIRKWCWHYYKLLYPHVVVEIVMLDSEFEHSDRDVTLLLSQVLFAAFDAIADQNEDETNRSAEKSLQWVKRLDDKRFWCYKERYWVRLAWRY